MNARRLIIPLTLALVALCSATATEAATRARTRGEPVLNDPVVRLAAGGFHTCHVRDDGTVRCWGDNRFGQLGDGTTTARLTPVTVPGVTSAVAVTAADSHTCVLLADGSARCWGDNDFGQLGDGTIVSRSTPGVVSGLTNAVAIAAGRYHTCALRADGSARCWGYNFFGQLGTGTTTDALTPVPVSGLGGAVGLIAGELHTCAVLAGGGTRCWGDNTVGELGDGTRTTRLVPVAVSGLFNVVALATPGVSAHACALLADGTVRCWGQGSSGQLGDGTVNVRTTPVAVMGLTNAVALATGGFHSCALVADGTARCWGGGAVGQLGDGSFTRKLTAVSVSGLINAVALAAGRNHTCALLADGSVACWGAGGLLGNGTTVSSGVPSTVSGGGGSITVRDVAAGDLHTCVVRANSTVSCWGYGNQGQLGDGSTGTIRLTAVTVSGLTTAVAIAAGGNHTCALLANGRARCWGYDGSGQIGDGFKVFSRPTPVPVVGLSNAVALAAGGIHTCALLADGTVRCWGDNRTGQLGDGTNITRTTPIPVVGLTNAVAIAAGANHTCALLVDGSARCWGYNANGQLGDGSITTRFSPVFVGGLFGNVVAITAGAYHSCALLVDGSGRCWGRGDKGQLGDGTTTAIQSLPGPVSGLANAVALSAGGDVSGDFGHSCALVANGGARCWGANESGQLGDGTTTSRLTPTVVSFQQNSLVTTLGLTTQIVTGSNHSCALQASGAVHCWGSNQVGQLGNGTKINKLRPGTLLSVSSTVLSVTLNIDPQVTLDHNTRDATVTILALCDEGQQLHVDVALRQGGVSGHGVGGGECTGGLGRYPVTVTAQGSDEFELGAAEVQAVGVISEDGVVVDNQEWTRAVQIVGPAPTLEGSATAVGTNKDSASVRLTGQFTAGSAIALDQATLTLSALLDEADGAGELVRGNGGATLLPLTLGARAGSTPTAAIYQTASGVRPVVWAEVKNRDPKTGRIEFSIKVDRATMPIGPALCSTGSPSTTELTTQFNLQVGTGTPVGVEVIVPWQCLGTQMRAP